MADKSNEDAMRDQLGDMFLRVIQDREGVVRELLAGILAAETMLRGLSKVVDAMDEIAEVLRTPPRIPEDVPVPEFFREIVQKAIDDSARRSRTVVSSIRAVAKTQTILAHYVRHGSMLLLTYASSDTFMTDATKFAARFGKGDQALRAMFGQKFGEDPGL